MLLFDESIMYKPREVHWKVALKILTYIKESSEKGLLYKKNEHLRIEAFSDSSYARDMRDKKSTSGYYTYVGENLVTWRNKKQTDVSCSSVKTEYIVMTHTT